MKSNVVEHQVHSTPLADNQDQLLQKSRLSNRGGTTFSARLIISLKFYSGKFKKSAHRKPVAIATWLKNQHATDATNTARAYHWSRAYTCSAVGNLSKMQAAVTPHRTAYARK